MIEVDDLVPLHAALGPGPRPDPDALVAGAAEALRRTAHDQAEALLDAAILLDPALASAWSLYGLLSVSRGRPDEARRAYERALTLDDTDAVTALALVELYARGREPRDGERALALANWLILEEGTPPEIVQRAAALKRGLRVGASS